MDYTTVALYAIGVMSLCFLLWYHIKKQVDWEGKLEFPKFDLNEALWSNVTLIAVLTLILWGKQGCTQTFEKDKAIREHEEKLELIRERRLDSCDVEYFKELREIIDEIICHDELVL